MFSRSPDRSPADDPRRGTIQTLGGPTPPGGAPQAPTDVTLIGRDDHFEGTISAHKLIRVAGSVKGRIEAVSVVIEAGGNVNAEVIADDVVVAGEYTGNLVCRKRLEVQASGRVSGRLETLKLVLQEGAAMDGEIHMTKPGEEPGVQVRPTSSVRGGHDTPIRSPAPSERGD